MRGVEGASSKSDSASKNSPSCIVRALVRVEGVSDSTAVANVACERTLASLCGDAAGTASVPNSFTADEGEVVFGEMPDCLLFWVSDRPGAGFGFCAWDMEESVAWGVLVATASDAV